MIDKRVMIAIAMKDGKMMRRKEYIGLATAKDAKEKVDWGPKPNHDTVIVYPLWQEEAYLRTLKTLEP